MVMYGLSQSQRAVEEREIKLRLTGCQFSAVNHRWWCKHARRRSKSAQVLKHVKMNKCACFVPCMQPCQSSCAIIWHQGRLRSNDNDFPWSVGPTCPPWKQRCDSCLWKKRRSRLVDVRRTVRAPVCLWSVCRPGHTDEQERVQIAPFEDLNHLLLIRLLWRCSVTSRL